MKKQEKVKKEKDYMHIVMWLVFLCFFLLFAFNSFTYAQYSTSNETINNASLAKFYVSSPNTDNITFDFNGSIGAEKTIPFQIVNFNENITTEVLLGYSIRISSYENLPLEYNLTCTSINEGNDVNTNNAFYDSEHQWNGGKLLAITPCTHNYTLTIRWKNGHYDANTYANEVDLIKIIIDSEQID